MPQPTVTLRGRAAGTLDVLPPLRPEGYSAADRSERIDEILVRPSTAHPLPVVLEEDPAEVPQIRRDDQSLFDLDYVEIRDES